MKLNLNLLERIAKSRHYSRDGMMARGKKELFFL